MKYLLTTSEDKCVIIAEVPTNHPHNDNEYRVSESMLQSNVSSGIFVESSVRTGDGGRVWVYHDDISA